MAQRIATLEMIAAMQADRDAGMSLRKVAAKHGWSPRLIWAKTSGASPRVATPRIIRSMQADRESGMSVAAIAQKHGWSETTVLAHTIGSPLPIVTKCVAAAMQADRDGGMLLADLSDKYGWSQLTVIKHTTGPRFRHSRNLARYRRILAANASPEADREAIAARFGLANKNVLSATVSKGRRFLAEAGRPSA